MPWDQAGWSSLLRLCRGATVLGAALHSRSPDPFLSKWTVFNKGQDNKLFSGASGYYDDTLVRVDGQWEFLKRLVTTDIPNPPASN